MMPGRIRLAAEADCAEILRIYTPYIKDTAVTFEYEVPDVAAFAGRMRGIRQKYPWLVCEAGGVIAGYAYASPFAARAAFGWAVDYSVYIRPDFHRRKIATALYTALSGLTRLQGFYTAFAGITVPNPQSSAFHEAFGFERDGVLRRAGYKFGAWYDLAWYRLALNDYARPPREPLTPGRIARTEAFSRILEDAGRIVAPCAGGGSSSPDLTR